MTEGAARFDREYFEACYRDYRRQNPDAKLRFYRDLVAPARAARARPRLLDLGCAFGAFLESVGPGWDRFGLDVSEYAIAAARERLPDVEFAVSGMERIPFPGSFDAVTAFDTVEHVERPEAVFEAVRERLTPGGRFVFVVPVYDGPVGPLVRMLDRDPTHIHRKARRFWLELASKSFRVEEWLGVWRYLLPLGPYLHFPTRALRAVSPAIAVVARPRA